MLCRAVEERTFDGEDVVDPFDADQSARIGRHGKDEPSTRMAPAAAARISGLFLLAIVDLSAVGERWAVPSVELISGGFGVVPPAEADQHADVLDVAHPHMSMQALLRLLQESSGRVDCEV